MNMRTMRSIVCSLAVLTMLGVSMSRAVVAADTPPSGFRADYVAELARVQKQIMELEQAIPQEKFAWRPSEGVRSVSEVFAHIAFGNYGILMNAGIPLPEGMQINMKEIMKDVKKWDETTSDKSKIAEMLTKSFEHAKAAILKTSDPDLDKKVKAFGTEPTVRMMFMIAIEHLHEHLGQAIAYARVNGIVPPWTEQRQKQAAPRK